MAKSARKPARKKVYPLAMRMPESDLSVIDRAASLRGRTRSDFIREAAVRAAEEAILENTFIRMSPKGFKAFMDMLEEPAKPVPELAEVLKRKAPWDK